MVHKITVTLLVIFYNVTNSIYIEKNENAVLEKKTDEGDYLMIKRTHGLVRREVFGRDSYSRPLGVRPNDETIIILPNTGVNNPFNTYPSSGFGSNDANGGTTVIVKSTDNRNGDKTYGGIPYKYG